MNLVTCFQEVVGDFLLPFSEEDNFEFAKRALEIQKTVPSKISWFCNTYSTLDSTYSLKDDPVFSKLVSEVLICASQFSEKFDIKPCLELTDAWLNVAEPGAFQEFHNHSKSHFSAVYYIQAELTSGNIIFKSHSGFDDMFGLPKVDTNQYNFSHYYFNPVPSRLLVFRSNLQHMVGLNKSSTSRIGASFNFIAK